MKRTVAFTSAILGAALFGLSAGSVGCGYNGSSGTGGKGGGAGTSAAGRGGSGGTASAGRGGTTGAGGTAGSAGTGGSAGAGGGAGAAGRGGGSGAGGGAGAGGSAGAGGGAGAGGSAGAAGAGGGSGAAGTGGVPGPVMLTVLASQHRIILDNCSVTPSTFANVAAGTHTISLTSSTLSKGNINGVTTQDPYVIVQIPLPAGDPRQHMRFFMLNGVGSSVQFMLPVAGTVRAMFIDSDLAYNAGSATLTLMPGATTATVDAMANVVRWEEACAATPASAVISNRAHRVTLTAATFSSGAGAEDFYVLVRLPIEQVATDTRFVILNNIGDGEDFVPFNNDTIRAWFISQSSGATGSGTLTVTDL
jgi:hypothetical protein